MIFQIGNVFLEKLKSFLFWQSYGWKTEAFIKMLVNLEFKISSWILIIQCLNKNTNFSIIRSNPKEKALLLHSNGSSKNKLRKARLSFQQYTSQWTADRIDRISMLLFPSLFTIFNIIYWGYYLLRNRWYICFNRKSICF